MQHVPVHFIHVRGEWHNHSYGMQRVYRRIQVRRDIHSYAMYSWNVRCVW